MGQLQSGQKAASAEMELPQFGQTTVRWAVPSAGAARSEEPENSRSIVFLPVVTWVGLVLQATVFLAVLTEAIDLKGVATGHVMVLAADFLFDLADLWRKELHRSTASGADHVVMAAAVVLVLVASDAIVKRDFTRKSRTSQKLERAIHGGKADVRVFFLDEPVQFIR